MVYYYLISTGSATLSYWKASGTQGQPSTWVSNQSVPANTVMNCIVYDGSSPFTAPAGQQLVSSANVYNIGDAYSG